MKYKIVSHNATSSPQAMERVLTELENDGWYLKELVSVGGGKVISVHTDVPPRSRHHGKIES